MLFAIYGGVSHYLKYIVVHNIICSTCWHIALFAIHAGICHSILNMVYIHTNCNIRWHITLSEILGILFHTICNTWRYGISAMHSSTSHYLQYVEYHFTLSAIYGGIRYHTIFNACGTIHYVQYVVFYFTVPSVRRGTGYDALLRYPHCVNVPHTVGCITWGSISRN